MKNATFTARLLLSTALLCTPLLRAQELPDSGAEIPRIAETEQRLGVFTLGGQAFTVLTRSQTISPASSTRFATTVSELQIRDTGGNPVFQENFPASLGPGRFLQALAVSASLLEGAGGRALLLRFVEDDEMAGRESWQMLGLVNGKLTRYGAPLPLGQGGAAVNGVLTGVMRRGGIGVVPLATTAEALEFRVWAGNFFVGVPVRIDWSGGQWSEAEQCFANEGGSLRPVGCNLRVTPIRQRVTEGAAVTLYEQPEENVYDARQVFLRADSAVEIPTARALVRWKMAGDRFACDFEELWLRVRIDGNEGWVRSSTDFAAMGLSSAPSPQQ